MNNLSNYIIEKLRINKDISVKEKEIKVLTDKYEVGDICLIVKHAGLRGQERITIDAIQITEKTKTILRYKYLTHFNNDFTSSYLKMTPTDVKKVTGIKYAFNSGTTSATIYITREDSLDILNKIRKDGGIDWFKELYIEYKSNKENITPAYQLKKYNTSSNKFNDYEPIKTETLDKIESIIKGEKS